MSIRCASRSRPSPDFTTARRRASSMSCRSAPRPRSWPKSRNIRRLAARLLAGFIDKEVQGLGVYSFSQSIRLGFDVGLINERVLGFVEANARKLNDCHRCVAHAGPRVLRPAHALRSLSAQASDAPAGDRNAAAFLDAHCGVAEHHRSQKPSICISCSPASTTSQARRRCSTAGTRHEQLSSCFLLDSPEDSLESIYDQYKDIALLSKFSGGIGIAWHRVRSEGSLIRATNGLSNGIVPWLKTLDSSVAAVNQGGKRKGAACVYLEPWHADIEAFLELRDNTGDEARRTHHLNLANWIPDLFMRRVEADGHWSLFDPKDVPELPDLFGAAFEDAYVQAEARGAREEDIARPRSVCAHDARARADRQRLDDVQGQVQPRLQSDREARATRCICRICAPRSSKSRSNGETAVCNLGSINLARHMRRQGFDFEKLAQTVADRRAPARSRHRPQLLPDQHGARLEHALAAGRAWRDGPAGCVLPAASAVRQRSGAQAFRRSIAEDDLLPRAAHLDGAGARARSRTTPSPDTRAAQGELQFDAWGVTPDDISALG